jgi:phosphoglycolate phosphatase
MRTLKRADVYLFTTGRYVSKMSKTRSVLLDLDGTLIDSQPGIVASCFAALRALGHNPNEALDITHFIGPPLEDMLRALLQVNEDDRIDEAVVAYRQHYGESGLLGSELYPGISNALQEMRQAGVRIYIATSKREAFARRIVEHLKLARYFDGIYGSVHGGKLDHKPDLLAHILSEQNLLASHTLMVGDRRYDIVGAHAVNMRGLGVLWGYGSRDELETAGADHLVELTADLAHTVLSMLDR